MYRVTAFLITMVVTYANGPVTATQFASDTLFVRSVSFQGNHNIPDETLRLAIATTQSSVFARHLLLRWMGLGQKRLLSDRELRLDVRRLKAFYGASGFPDATVDTMITRTGRNVSVRFRIDEGAPVLVKTLKLFQP